MATLDLRAALAQAGRPGNPTTKNANKCKNKLSRSAKNAKIAKLIKSYKECKLISNFGTKNIEDGLRLIEEDYCDFLSCATFYVSNPDVSLRLKRNVPLRLPDESLYYTDGVEGYIDY